MVESWSERGSYWEITHEPQHGLVLGLRDQGMFVGPSIGNRNIKQKGWVILDCLECSSLDPFHQLRESHSLQLRFEQVIQRGRREREERQKNASVVWRLSTTVFCGCRRNCVFPWSCFIHYCEYFHKWSYSDQQVASKWEAKGTARWFFINSCTSWLEFHVEIELKTRRHIRSEFMGR